MSAGNHAIQNGVELALRTSTNNTNFFVGKFDDVFHFHDGIFGDFDGFGTESNFDVVDHRKARESDFATAFVGLFENQANTLNLR